MSGNMLEYKNSPVCFQKPERKQNMKARNLRVNGAFGKVFTLKALSERRSKAEGNRLQRSSHTG